VLVTPRPGVSQEILLKNLRELHDSVFNFGGGGGPGPAQARIRTYLEWTVNAARQLGYLVSASDIDRLVLTVGYNRLLGVVAMPGTEVGTQRVLNGMLSLELDLRVEAFDAAVKALQAQIARWHTPGVFVAADSTGPHPARVTAAEVQALFGLSLAGVPPGPVWPWRVLRGAPIPDADRPESALPCGP
jgi:hypothetical protein